MKRSVMTGLAVMLLLSGCAKGLLNQQPASTAPVRSAVGHAPASAPAPAPAPAIAPPTDGAAVAQDLSSDEVLNRASFVGGTLGDQAYHPGQVLLWQPEPNRYRLRVSLDLGDGQWRSSNNTNELMFEPATFTASVALLNDLDLAERAVPLWAFHGHVGNPDIARVELRIPGVRLLTGDVKRGTWLLVYQGVLTTGPDEATDVIAYNAAGQEITRKTIMLQR